MSFVVSIERKSNRIAARAAETARAEAAKLAQAEAWAREQAQAQSDIAAASAHQATNQRIRAENLASELRANQEQVILERRLAVTHLFGTVATIIDNDNLHRIGHSMMLAASSLREAPGLETPQDALNFVNARLPLLRRERRTDQGDCCFFSILAQVSRSVVVRLKTGRPFEESASAQK